MGIDGHAIASATTGFSQGLDQGFDLVNKYQQIQDANDKRRKQQEIQAGAAEIAKQGLFQKDPEQALSMTRDLYLKAGDLEGAHKYQENLVAMREANKKKSLGEAWERFQINDYEGAVELLNGVYAKSGKGTQLQYTQGPDGKPTLTGTQDGKPFASAYGDDPMEFKSDLAERISNLLLGPEKAIEEDRLGRVADANIAQSEAASRASDQQVEESKALLPGQQAIQTAQAGSLAASAAASRASAGKSAAETAELKDPNNPTRRKAIADAASAEQELANANASDMAAYLKDNPPGGDMLIATEGPAPIHTDANRVAEVGLAVQSELGTDTASSAQLAREAMEKATDINEETGFALINGVPVKIGKKAALAIERQLSSRQAPSPDRDE